MKIQKKNGKNENEYEKFKSKLVFFISKQF